MCWKRGKAPAEKNAVTTVRSGLCRPLLLLLAHGAVDILTSGAGGMELATPQEPICFLKTGSRVYSFELTWIWRGLRQLSPTQV